MALDQKPVVGHDEWLKARMALVDKEKQITRLKDSMAKERQQLPMVKIEKDYEFTGPDGKVRLAELFEGYKQLVIYHTMWERDSNLACRSCSFFNDHIPRLCHLRSRNTNMAVVSRAPFEKIKPFKERMGWTFPWYSVYGSDFNWDFYVTQNEHVRPVFYNFRNKQELLDSGFPSFTKGDQPGISVLHRDEKTNDVFLTYLAYSRGTDVYMTHALLDMTPLGRQDNGARGPVCKLHDEY